MADISTPGISELGTPLERLSELARRFSFDIKIAEKMVDTGPKDLQNFRYIATSAETAASLVTTSGIEEATKITQAAWVGCAWHEVRACLEILKQSRKKSKVGEVSAPLEKPNEEGQASSRSCRRRWQ
jgi:hypothetical protein